MDCKQVMESLNEYVDGFLPAERKELVEAHLSQCAACKNEVEALLKLRGQIRALKIENTDDFVFDIERAKAPAVLPLRRQGWLRAITATAACFVLLIGVYTAVQNGYQTPAEQTLSADGADAASDVAFAGETEQVNKTAEQSRHTKTMTVSEEYTYRTVPEGVTPFSSVILDVEAAEESQNAKVEFFDDTYTKEHAINALVPEDMSASDVPESAEDVWVEQKSSDATAGGGSGAATSSGSTMSVCVNTPVYTKRTVTLSVRAEAQETFSYILSGMATTRVDGETAIGESDLDLLLRIEGVQVVSDQSVTCDTESYVGKVVIVY